MQITLETGGRGPIVIGAALLDAEIERLPAVRMGTTMVGQMETLGAGFRGLWQPPHLLPSLNYLLLS
jgi:hypothetical protein